MKAAKDPQPTNEFNNVILYDGVCNFCNGWVDLVLSADKEKKFRFAAMQSKAGMEALQLVGREAKDLSSVVLVQSTGDKYTGYIKSEAARQVLKELELPVFSPVGGLLMGGLPMGLKDRVYDAVARNRYNFLGKRSTFERLNGEDADRFLN